MPKAIAPNVAQINIDRFKKSVIQKRLGKGRLGNHAVSEIIAIESQDTRS